MGNKVWIVLPLQKKGSLPMQEVSSSSRVKAGMQPQENEATELLHSCEQPPLSPRIHSLISTQER